MDVIIVGAGAMGSLLASGLAETHHTLRILDTQPRVRQIHACGGIEVVDLDNRVKKFQVDAIYADGDSARADGPADLIILATKSHVLPTIAAEVASLCTEQTVLLPIQNGIPWWYLYQASCAHSKSPILTSVDPHGLLDQHLDVQQVLGCVAYPAAQLDENGSVTHIEGVRFPVGEQNGQVSERAGLVAALLEEAGFKSRVIEDIHAEVWLKAWGSLSINVVSALTRATMADICNHQGTQRLVRGMMSEAQSVAHSLGVTMRHTIDKRIDGARSVGQHKTSTLQDVEAGRPMELKPLLGAVIELAQRTGVATPTLDTIYACADLLNETLIKQQDDVSQNPADGDSKVANLAALG